MVENKPLTNEDIAAAWQARRRQLKKEYEHGTPVKDLSFKYKLTTQGIYKLLRKEGVVFTRRTKSVS